MKFIKRLLQVSITAMIICIVIGGLVFFFYINRFSRRFGEVQEKNRILTERHVQELSNTVDKIKVYKDTHGVTVNIDDYETIDDSIIIKFTVDTNTFTFEETEEFKIPENIKNKEVDFATVTVNAIKDTADFNDEEFYKSFTTENFMMSYNLTQHYKALGLDPNYSNNYGYLLCSTEELPIRKPQINSLLFNDERQFTLVLNKNVVKHVIVSINYRVSEIEYSNIYMVVQ